MRRVFFTFAAKPTFAGLLINWIKEQYKEQEVQVHHVTLDSGTSLQVFFDTQPQFVSGLVREYEGKFLPENRGHFQEGEFEPEISVIEVTILVRRKLVKSKNS